MRRPARWRPAPGGGPRAPPPPTARPPPPPPAPPPRRCHAIRDGRRGGRREIGPGPAAAGHRRRIPGGCRPTQLLDQGGGRRRLDPSPRVVSWRHAGGRRRAAGGRVALAHVEPQDGTGRLDRSLARRGERRGRHGVEENRLYGRTVTVLGRYDATLYGARARASYNVAS